jgi:hypothetical protein
MQREQDLPDLLIADGCRDADAGRQGGQPFSQIRDSTRIAARAPPKTIGMNACGVGRGNPMLHNLKSLQVSSHGFIPRRDGATW